MSALTLQAASSKPLTRVSAALDAGMHAIVGSPLDGTSVLIELLSGLRAPTHGRIQLRGTDPYRNPETRSHIGAVLANDPLPMAGNLESCVRRLLTARSDRRSAGELLEEFGLSHWAARPMHSLSGAERRAVAAALSLSLPEPWLLAFHEPTADLEGMSGDFVLQRLRELAQAGTCVVCTTASLSTAAQITKAPWLLEYGRLRESPGPPLLPNLTPGAPLRLSIITQDARPLCEQLSGNPAVLNLEYNAELSPREVVVQGRDFEQLALAVMRAIVHSGISVHAIEPRYPALDQVHAAHAGLARAAYENAYLSAKQYPVPQASPAAPYPASPQPGNPRPYNPSGSSQ